MVKPVAHKAYATKADFTAATKAAGEISALFNTDAGSRFDLAIQNDINASIYENKLKTVSSRTELILFHRKRP